MIHYSLAEDPVRIEEYTTLLKTDKPLLLLGSIIKNRYDEARLVFNESARIKSIIIGDTTIKGIQLDPSLVLNLDLLFEQLKLVSDPTLTPEFYEKTLKQFNLSSSECYSYLRKSIYPINGECITTITSSTLPISEYYDLLFDKTTACSWQNLSYLTLFILINKD